MIFSKTGIDGIPLWFLIWQGRKSITRRPPPCKHCKYKEWEHSENQHICSVSSYTEEEDENGDPYSYTTHYEPDFSKWKPRIINKGTIREISSPKEIAVQPKRGKAAICKNCGGWKDWHEEYMKKQKSIPKFGFTVKFRTEFHTQQPWIFIEHFFKIEKEEEQKICNNYSPLKVRIKSVQMEHDWEDDMEDRWDRHEYHSDKLSYIDEERHKEALKEGFSSWEKLQEALSIYPKGTKLARIEFTRD